MAKFLRNQLHKPSSDPSTGRLSEYSRLLDLSQDAILLRNAQDQIIYWNGGAQEVYGFTEEEALGQVSHILLRTEFSQPLQEIRAKILRDGRWTGELVHTRRDGRRITTFSRWVVERDSQGDLQTILESNTDITERKRAEEALHESEERLRIFIEHAPAAIAVFDREMCYLALSDRWRRDYHLNGTVVGRSHYQIFPEIPEHWKEVHRRAMTGEVLRSDEDGFRRADGKIQWIKWEARPWRLVTGEIGGILIATEDVTEAVLAKEALRRSQEQLALISNAVPALISYVDTQCVYRFCNQAYTEWFGFSISEIIGRPMREVVGEKAWSAIGPHVRAALQGVKADFETEAEYARGQTRWIHAIYTPDRGPSGNVVGLVILVSDVTLRRKAEEALRLEEARLSTVLDHLSEGVVIGTETGELSYWNSAGLKMHGYRTADEGNRQLSTFTETFKLLTVGEREEIPFNDWPMPKILRGETVRNYEVLLRRTDQNWEKIVSYTGAVVESGAGERLAYLSIFELTEQRKAEAALKESEERFRQLAETIPQLAWMTNADGWIFWYNRRWFEYTGASFEQMQGWGWQSVHHPDHVERVTAKFKHAIAIGEPWEDTFPLRGQNGEYRWFLSRAFPIQNATGKIVRWFGTNTDITELRETQEALTRAQNHLQEHAQTLEATVEARTRELSEALVKAREVDRLKSEFLSTMSHELRTPLNSIIGFTRLVIEERPGPLNAEQKKQLSMAHNSALHLLNLISDLLDLSRIEAGKSRVVIENFSPEQLVDEVIRTLRPLGKTEVSMIKEVSLPETIASDRRKVFQVLLNLANNAVKFTQKGEIKIRAFQSEGRLVCEVVDSGIGIKPENMQMLFEAFRQVDASPTRRYDGTGLGLYLSKKLVTLLGGEIWAKSEVGQGSKFGFSIPINRVSPEFLSGPEAAGGVA